MVMEVEESEDEPQKSEHKPLRYECEPLKSECEPLKSGDKPIKSEDKPIKFAQFCSQEEISHQAMEQGQGLMKQEEDLVPAGAMDFQRDSHREHEYAERPKERQGYSIADILDSQIRTQGIIPPVLEIPQKSLPPDQQLDMSSFEREGSPQIVEIEVSLLPEKDVSNIYTVIPEPQNPYERRMKWGTIIPLIGGSAIGCYKATGTMPFFHLTYSEFAGNESHFKRYWPHIPFINLDKKDHLKYDLTGLDFINSVCPCAGLSMLNSSQSSHKGRGADASQNKWMIESAEFVLGKIKPKVYWGENAPGLFTKTGEQMLKKMREIGQTHGYTFSVVKTNTELHGIPQRRIRSFYFYWNTPTVPILNYKERPKPNLVTYLKEIPPTATLQDMFMTEGKASIRFRPYQFVLEREGLTHMEFSAKYGKGTISQYLHGRQLIDECIDWLKVHYPTESFYCKNINKPGRTFIMYLEHMKMKLSKGLGYWDDSPR